MLPSPGISCAHVEGSNQKLLRALLPPPDLDKRSSESLRYVM